MSSLHVKKRELLTFFSLLNAKMGMAKTQTTEFLGDIPEQKALNATAFGCIGLGMLSISGNISQPTVEYTISTSQDILNLMDYCIVD